MNHREHVKSIVDHNEGAVPMDFGAGPTTGVHVNVIGGLRAHYGLKKIPVKVIEPFQMLGEVDEELQNVLGIACEGITGRTNFFGFENTGWKEWRAPWGQDVLVPRDFNTTTDASGATYLYPQGDRSVPPSGKMPQGGWFFDDILRQDPDLDLDTVEADGNKEDFADLTAEDVAYVKREATRAASTGRYVLANLGGTALGDIACVPAPFLKHPKGVRDVASWYMLTAIRPEVVKEIFAYESDIALRSLAKIKSVAEDSIDALYICGTDFGTQNGLFSSPECFDDVYAPYYAKINGWIHENTKWKTFKHSCGAIEPVIDRLIDCGFDILNPVQCSAAGMEPGLLKKKYGDRIVFWGGGINTQKTLPFGTPEEVRAEVLERCEVFSPGGGFVFNTIHNALANTPIANFVAMVDAVKEFNVKFTR